MAMILVVIGAIGIWMEEGFSGVQRVFSPFNIPNSLVIIITLSPAIGAFALANYVQRNKGGK